MTGQRSSLMKTRGTLSTTLSTLPPAVPPSTATAIKELVAHLREFNETIASAVAVIEAVGAHPEVSPVDVDNCLVDVRDFRECRDSIQSQTDNHGFLGHAFAGLDTQVTSIRTTLRFAEAIDTSGLSEGTVEWLLAKDCLTRLLDLRDWLVQVNRLAGEAQSTAAEIGKIAGGTEWTNAAAEPVGSLLKRAADAISHRDALTPWSHFVRVQAESRVS